MTSYSSCAEKVQLLLYSRLHCNSLLSLIRMHDRVIFFKGQLTHDGGTSHDIGKITSTFQIEINVKYVCLSSQHCSTFATAAV